MEFYGHFLHGFAYSWRINNHYYGNRGRNAYPNRRCRYIPCIAICLPMDFLVSHRAAYSEADVSIICHILVNNCNETHFFHFFMQIWSCGLYHARHRDLGDGFDSSQTDQPGWYSGRYWP